MMDREIRHYNVGGFVFGLEVCAPYSFMEYTEPVLERIRRAAAGELYPVLPTRAGDEVPPRTLFQRREELPESRTGFSLDLSQYEPFRTGDGKDSMFTLSVQSPGPELSSEGETIVLNIDDTLPSYTIGRIGESTVFRFKGSDGFTAAVLTLGSDSTCGSFIPVSRDGKMPASRPVSFFVNMALMIMYTYNASREGALLIHSSVISHEGMANLFLGKSGTGKSTHSRLWLDFIEGTQLLNDDNPVLRFQDGSLYVYGTPWSGKTPCYRNTSRKVRAIVNLKQAPYNRIEPIKGIPAYSYLLSSVSSVRWDRRVMDSLTSTLSDIAMTVPCYVMECLPDEDAARTCLSGISRNSE